MDSTMTMRIATRNGTDINTKINGMGNYLLYMTPGECPAQSLMSH